MRSRVGVGPGALVVVKGVSPDTSGRVGFGVDEELMSAPGDDEVEGRKEEEGSQRSARELVLLCLDSNELLLVAAPLIKLTNPPSGSSLSSSSMLRRETSFMPAM